MLAFQKPSQHLMPECLVYPLSSLTPLAHAMQVAARRMAPSEEQLADEGPVSSWGQRNSSSSSSGGRSNVGTSDGDTNASSGNTSSSSSCGSVGVSSDSSSSGDATVVAQPKQGGAERSMREGASESTLDASGIAGAADTASSAASASIKEHAEASGSMQVGASKTAAVAGGNPSHNTAAAAADDAACHIVTIPAKELQALAAGMGQPQSSEPPVIAVPTCSAPSNVTEDAATHTASAPMRDALLPLPLDLLHAQLWQRLSANDKRAVRAINKEMRAQASECVRQLNIAFPSGLQLSAPLSDEQPVALGTSLADMLWRFNQAGEQQQLGRLSKQLAAFPFLAELWLQGPSPGSMSGKLIKSLFNAAVMPRRGVRKMHITDCQTSLSSAFTGLPSALRSSLSMLHIGSSCMDGLAFDALASCPALRSLELELVRFGDGGAAEALLLQLTQVGVGKVETRAGI